MPTPNEEIARFTAVASSDTVIVTGYVKSVNGLEQTVTLAVSTDLTVTNSTVANSVTIGASSNIPRATDLLSSSEYVSGVGGLFGAVTLTGTSDFTIAPSTVTNIITFTPTSNLINVAEGLDVDSLNALTGALTIVGTSDLLITSTGTVITVTPTSNLINSAGVAGVGSLNALTGVVTLSSGSGLNIVTSTATNDIAFSLDASVLRTTDIMASSEFVASVNGLFGSPTITGTTGEITVTNSTVGNTIIVGLASAGFVKSLNSLSSSITLAVSTNLLLDSTGQVLTISPSSNLLTNVHSTVYAAFLPRFTYISTGAPSTADGVDGDLWIQTT